MDRWFSNRWFSLRRLASLVLLALSLYFLGRTLLELSGSITTQAVMPGEAALFSAVILSLAWIFTMAVGWVWMLRFHSTAERLPRIGLKTEYQPSGSKLFVAFMHAFISRYVPGKVWPALVLCERLRDDLPAPPLLRSYLLQQLHLLASAGVLSVGILPLLSSDVDEQSILYSLSIPLAFLMGLMWACLPKPLFAVARSFLPGRWREHLVFNGSITSWATGFAIFVAVGVFQGAALIPIWQAVAEPDQLLSASDMVAVVCAYAAARVIGQGVVIVPAGIGVREAAFVVLVSTLSPQAALISVLWLRLVATLVEFAVWLAALLINRWDRSRE